MATVRRASLADADAIGRVHVRAWQAAYRGVMPDRFLDELDPAQRAAMWRDRLRGDDPSVETLVAIDGGAVVGFAVAGVARDDDAEGIGELHAINLTPAAWGRGIGSQLLDAAEAGLRARGYDAAMLWVARDNDRACRFYEEHGWTADGAERTGEVLGAVVDEVRYRKQLFDHAA